MLCTPSPLNDPIVVTADMHLYTTNSFTTDLIKIDVEGAEVR